MGWVTPVYETLRGTNSRKWDTAVYTLFCGTNNSKVNTIFIETINRKWDTIANPF